MQVTAHTHARLRRQNLLFVLLFLLLIGLLGWLSNRYNLQTDWTANGRNSLSMASVALLERLPGPIDLTLYATDDASLRDPVSELVERYRRYKAQVELTIINPQKDPRNTREAGVTSDGELFVSYQGRSEQLKFRQIDEHGLSNALQRLARAGARYLVFLEGHGERRPLGQANHDLNSWGKQLESKGFKLQPLNLATRKGEIPDNTAVLVIASPQVDLLPGEVQQVLTYLQRGGNLLWLAEPDGLHGLTPVAEYLGIEFLPGTLVDPRAAQMLGPEAALYALGADYGMHPISEHLDLITLYPQAAGFEVDPASGWQADVLVRSTPDSWVEAGQLDGEVHFDAGTDHHGPVALGVALWRTVGNDGTAPDDESTAPAKADLDFPAGGTDTPGAHTQRVVVIGDGDFLSNTYGGNGGNLAMGSNIVNWLSHDDRLLDIPVRLATDVQLQFSGAGTAAIALTFLVLLPLSLLLVGLLLWWRRRRS